MNTLKNKMDRTIIAIALFMQSAIYAVRHRWNTLKQRPQAGMQTVEWIFLVVGILALAGIVILAVTAFVNTQTAKLPS